MKTTDLTLYGSNASLSTASPLPTAVEHASVAGYEYTAPQQVNAFNSGYENILDMGFLSGMDTFPDMGSLFGSDALIPGAGSQWASNHSDEYGEASDEPAATGTGSTETTGNGQGGETAGDTTDGVEHSEENTATDNADSTDNQQRVPTADEIKALMSRIEQGNVTARDVAERFVTDENGKEWAIVDGSRVDPAALVTGAAIPVGADGQPTGQPVYSLVMDEGTENEDSGGELTDQSEAKGTVDSDEDKPETAGSPESAGETGAPDTVHPDSFAAINKDWDFGDGSVKDNPATADYVRQQYVNIYGAEPTAEQLEAMVQSVTYIAQTQPASVFNGDYISLCNAVVEIGSDAQSTGEPAGKDEVQQQTEGAGEPKVTNPGGNINDLANSAAQQNNDEAINRDIALYNTKIAVYYSLISNPAHVNKATYEQIKKLTDEIKEKAKSNSRYSEIAAQAQSLMGQFVFNTQIKLGLSTRLGALTIEKLDRLMNGEGTLMIAASSETNAELQNSNRLMGGIDAVREFKKGSELKGDTGFFKTLQSMGVNPKKLVFAAHSDGNRIWSSHGENDLFKLAELTDNFDFTQLPPHSTVIFNQCQGYQALEGTYSGVSLKNKIIEQFRKAGKLSQLEGMTIYARDHVASANGAIGTDWALEYLDKFINSGIQQKWYKYEFTANGGVIQSEQTLPAYSCLTNEDRQYFEDKRNLLLAYLSVETIVARNLHNNPNQSPTENLSGDQKKLYDLSNQDARWQTIKEKFVFAMAQEFPAYNRF